MAEENKEKYSIDFNTNANAAAKDVQGLSASINQTTEATKKLEKEALELDKTFDEVYDGMKPLTARMGEAEDRLYELALAGQTASSEYQGLLEKVAQYRKTQIETDRVVDAAATTLGQKLGGAAQLAATGVSGVTAGMALFGDQSEETEKALLKVQAAMAFADAISNISTMGGQWRILKDSVLSSSIATKANTAATGAAAIVQNLFTGSVTTTTAGFKMLKFAIAATGIGLLVVGAVAIIQNFEKISKIMTNLVPGLAGVGDAIGNIVQAVTDFVGVTSEADRAISRMKSSADASLALNKKFLAEHGSQLDEFTKQKIAAKDEYSNAIKEDGANQVALAGELNRKLAAIEYSRGDEAREIAKENAEKAAEESKKLREKQLADAKKLADEKLAEEKRIADEKLAADMASAREAIKILDELAKEKETPAQKEQREFEEKKLVLEANNISIEELYASHLAKLTEIERLEREKKTEQENEYWASEADKSMARTEEEKKKQDTLNAIQTESKDRMLANGESLAKGVQTLAGKNKAVQKAAIIAEGGINLGKTISNTAAAVASDLKLGFPANIAPIALDIATGAISAASIVSGTNKALQAVGGGGSITAPAAQQVPSGVSAAPQTGFQASSENQIATSISQQNQTQITKTYVVGSEVKTQTDLDAKLIQQNSFG